MLNLHFHLFSILLQIHFLNKDLLRLFERCICNVAITLVVVLSRFLVIVDLVLQRASNMIFLIFISQCI